MSKSEDGKSKLYFIQQALKERGIMRSGELEALGVSREYLRQLHTRGLLERVGRGLYRVPTGEITVNHSLVEASRRVPQGIICLLSALRYHQVTTQSPHEVWVAVDRKAWHPRITDFPVHLVSFSGLSLTEGLEEYLIEGVPVRIYSLAKTVADCFKYRNKIGLDVALEALREALREKRVPVDALWHYAKLCRVAKVMRPYLEAMA